MIELIKGAEVNGAEKLDEGYKVYDGVIVASVTASKIRKVIDNFIETNQKEPLFLFVEAPSNLKDEHIIKEKKEERETLDKAHNDVYYLDGLDSTQIKEILDDYGTILINDGMSYFGVGLNTKKEEIGKYKYNCMTLYSYEGKIDKYRNIFEKESIFENDNLITASDIINENNPGECIKYILNDKDIYYVIDKLKKQGMYKYEQRINKEGEINYE